jgi:Flp pilus assembly pilin Flp
VEASASAHRQNGTEGEDIVKSLIAAFVHEEEGQDVVEYALLAAFISIVAATLFSNIGGDLSTIFTAVKTQTGTAAS